MGHVAIFIAVLIVLLMVGVPVATSFGLSSIIYILMEDIPTAIVAQRMVANVDSVSLMCVPLFIFAGEIMSQGGIAKRLVRVFNLLFGNITGGLAYVTIIVCMFFAALTGSAMACSVAIGSILLPYMLKAGYDRNFAAAIVAAGAVMGPIVPPSTSLVVYATTASQYASVSIADLYKAGIPSGVLFALFLCVCSFFICKKRGYKGLPRTYGLSEIKGFENIRENDALSGKQIARIILEAVPAMIAPILILGSLFSGICTATESAVVAVLYSYFVGIFVYKEIHFTKVVSIVRITCKNLSTVLWIMGCAGLFAWVLSYSRVPDMLLGTLAPVANQMGSWVILLMIIVIILIMGCFMGASAIILIVVPLFLPLMLKLGYNAVHFGTVVSIACCIGFITPPFGNVLFTTMSVADVKLHQLSKATLPFLLAMVLGLLLIAFIPNIVMWIV